MSFAAQGTPQRLLPGAFMNTPAPNRTQLYQAPARFSAPPSAPSQNIGPQQQSQSAAGQQAATSSSSAPRERSPVERGAQYINDLLESEARFPELDSYVTREYAYRLGALVKEF